MIGGKTVLQYSMRSRSMRRTKRMRKRKRMKMKMGMKKIILTPQMTLKVSTQWSCTRKTRSSTWRPTLISALSNSNKRLVRYRSIPTASPATEFNSVVSIIRPLAEQPQLPTVIILLPRTTKSNLHARSVCVRTLLQPYALKTAIVGALALSVRSTAVWEINSDNNAVCAGFSTLTSTKKSVRTAARTY